jgi:hypothetical protein
LGSRTLFVVFLNEVSAKKETFCFRFYDMAADTSGDAKVPVALALAKLAVVFAWKNAEELKLIVGKYCSS